MLGQGQGMLQTVVLFSQSFNFFLQSTERAAVVVSWSPAAAGISATSRTLAHIQVSDTLSSLNKGSCVYGENIKVCSPMVNTSALLVSIHEVLQRYWHTILASTARSSMSQDVEASVAVCSRGSSICSCSSDSTASLVESYNKVFMSKCTPHIHLNSSMWKLMIRYWSIGEHFIIVCCLHETSNS